MTEDEMKQRTEEVFKMMQEDLDKFNKFFESQKEVETQS